MLAWDPTARRDADGQLRANIVIVDIEAQQLRREVTQQADTRFIFLCSDSHRRHLLRDVGQHWYTQCENYTLLNKPVKRQFLWTALTSQGHIEEAPTTAAIERIQNEFSFRRGDRPLRKHPPRNPGANDQSPASSYRRQADAASSHAGSQHSYASQRASDHRASPRSDRFIFSFGQSGGGGASGGAGGSSSLHGAKASSSGPHLAPANSSASATLAMAASGGASTTMVGSSATLNGVVTPPLLTIDQTPGSSALDLAETSDAAKQPPLAAAAAPPATAPSIEEVDLVTAQPARILLAEDNQINVKVGLGGKASKKRIVAHLIRFFHRSPCDICPRLGMSACWPMMAWRP